MERGWIGDPEKVFSALENANADRDENGKIILYGKGPIFGIDGSCIVGESTDYSVALRRYGLLGLMRSSGTGTPIQIF